MSPFLAEHPPRGVFVFSDERPAPLAPSGEESGVLLQVEGGGVLKEAVLKVEAACTVLERVLMDSP